MWVHSRRDWVCLRPLSWSVPLRCHSYFFGCLLRWPQMTLDSVRLSIRHLFLLEIHKWYFGQRLSSGSKSDAKARVRGELSPESELRPALEIPVLSDHCLNSKLWNLKISLNFRVYRHCEWQLIAWLVSNALKDPINNSKTERLN